MVRSSLPAFICPDCLSALPPTEGTPSCPDCGRHFREDFGILHFLPSEVDCAPEKEAEREGWARLGFASLEAAAAEYLRLPYVEDDSPVATHFREAAREFRVALEFLSPLEGKVGLDLGGAIGWAAYRFTREGARMSLADYNDSTPSGLGGARVFHDAGFRFPCYRVDAHQLPFANAQFDFVYCCAFLHHMHRPEVAIREIGRILKPGGALFASLEAFCPWWLSRAEGLARSDGAMRHVGEGINEQVFYHGDYERWLSDAGLRTSVFNPRWDVAKAGTIERGVRLSANDYIPEVLANRAGYGGLAGVLSRLAIRTSAWRLFGPLTRFDLARRAILASTQKRRILIGIRG